MIRILLAATVLLSLPSGASAVECYYGRFTLFVGRTTNVYMTARSGQSCTIGYLRVRERYGFHGAQILARPKNGTATAQSYVITYQARAGFKGRDQFVFAVRGSRHGWQKPVFQSRANVIVTVE